MSILLLTFDPHRDLKSWGEYVSLEQGERPTECLVLARKHDSTLKPAAYVIPLNNLFKFIAPDDAEEEFELIRACNEIAQVLECPTDREALMRIAMYVQDNVDKVYNLKPYDGQGELIGAAEGKLNGESFTSEVRLY